MNGRTFSQSPRKREKSLRQLSSCTGVHSASRWAAWSLLVAVSLTVEGKVARHVHCVYKAQKLFPVAEQKLPLQRAKH